MESIRDLQLVCLDILKVVDKICRDNNIKYFLDSGTLIGAVRHKGFIPWDDDLDIAMPRNDYNRFLKIAQELLGDNYFLQTYKTDDYPYPFARVRKNCTYIEESRFKNLNMNKGIYIDIFPLDNLPNNKIKRVLFLNKIKFLYKLGVVADKRVIYSHHSKKKNILKKFIRFFIAIFFFNKDKIYKILDKNMQKYKDFKSKNFLNISSSMNLYKKYKKGESYPCHSWIKDIIEIDFEGYRFFSPENYDEYLKEFYGDYMQLPPEEERKPGHSLSYSID